MNVAAFELCLLTHIEHKPLEEYLNFLKLAVKGGITCVQYRDKINVFSRKRTIGLALKALLAPLNVPLLINDDVALAIAIDADGVHLGQSDLPPVAARRLLGGNKIIGYSIESYAQLEQANQLDCIDYLAASAVFPSRTKTDCQTIWGLEGLKRFSFCAQHPVIAIGGINSNNVSDVIRQGVSGVAVISAVHAHTNPLLAVKELITNIQRGKLHAPRANLHLDTRY